LVGGILIKPVLGLVPVLLNSASRKPVTNNPDSSLINGETPAEVPIDPNYIRFFPLVIQNESFSEDQQGETWNERVFSSIDFTSNGSPINMTIMSKDGNESEKWVEVLFLPGSQCIYGDGQACIFAFHLHNQTQVVFASIHSGLGGEGEPFRDMVEGTGINRGLFTPDQVENSMASIAGSDVFIKQGDLALQSLELTAIARIPPAFVEAYLALPIESTLDYAVEIGVLNPELLRGEVFILETCGWQLPGEETNANYPSSAQSIYLGVVRSVLVH
ncbi:MAG TPA: hypothetical protein PLE10_05870, partial [Brevefilum sp.]|nr:hypothetical protein [Brevefilum sp.]HPL69749.1 hypothetical protein [Brevefilum sp.]